MRSLGSQGTTISILLELVSTSYPSTQQTPVTPKADLQLWVSLNLSRYTLSTGL